MSLLSPNFRGSFDCPVCGESVPANAKSCPECGACEKSGWNGEAFSDGLDLPDSSFDHRKFLEDEFGAPASRSPRERLWWLIAVILLIACLCLFLAR